MRPKKSAFARLVARMASLKLAVVVILAIGSLTAWGTIVEAKYNDSGAAQRIVYHSVWMYGVMGLLAVNLISVMIDRWPWKQRHMGFVLAHIGILILLFGSIVTSVWGVDGSLSVGIGETSNNIIIGPTDLTVYTSLDGSSYRKLFDREVDFFSDPPTEQKPVMVEIPTGTIKIVQYLPYALRDQKIVESHEDRAGAGVRFQLQNPNVNVTDWLVQSAPGRDAIKDLGPAQVIWTDAKVYNGSPDRNAIVLRPHGETEVSYEVHTAREPKKIKRGITRAGETVETGWRMGLVLRVLKYLPKAREEVLYKGVPAAVTGVTTGAIQVDYEGVKHWMGVNSLLKLFNDQAVFVVTYANRRLDIGFPLKLKEFKIDRYQGTMRAAAYQSLVQVPNLGEQTISMNEPLKHNGYTLYQSSFNEDEQGRPVASILSVNRDPGRWIKYLGSLFIVSGTIHLFISNVKWRARLRPTNRWPPPVLEEEVLHEKTLRNFGIGLLSSLLATLIVGLVIGVFKKVAYSADKDTSALRSLPVQDAGRIKPFDTLARETLQLIYGSESYKTKTGEKRPAIEIIMTWMLVPQYWDTQKIVEVSHHGLKDSLKLDQGEKYFSPSELFANDRLGLVMQELAAYRETKQKLNPYFQSVQRLESQLGMYQAIKQGTVIRVVPPSVQAVADAAAASNAAGMPMMGGPGTKAGEVPASPSNAPKAPPTMPGGKMGQTESQRWQSVADLQGDLQQKFAAVTQAFIQALPGTGTGGPTGAGTGGQAGTGTGGQANTSGDTPPTSTAPTLSLTDTVEAFKTAARAQNPELYPEEKTMDIEVHYKSLHPFMIAWTLYLLAAIFLGAAWQVDRKWLYAVGWACAAAAFAMHTYGFGLRIYITGRPPVSNMYESVVWVSWGVVLFSIIFEAIGRRKFVLLAGASVATICLVIADLAPAVLDNSIQPLEPVLRSNMWLTVHVLTITLSYSAFFLAWGISNLGLGFILRGESVNDERTRALAHSTYRAIQVGVVLLAAGTILGGIWADYSWGRFWGWDPKKLGR